MAQIYKAGEIKIRPDVYYRFSNKGKDKGTGAVDGVNALVMKASWGPVGEVRTFTRYSDLLDAYGECDGTEAASILFEEGASKVLVYRAGGTGGAKATGTLGTSDGSTISARYEGTLDIKVKVQNKAGDSTKKEVMVIVNGVVKESFLFPAGESDSADLKAALAKSAYVEVTTAGTGAAAVEEVALSGGKDPTVTSAGYSAGFLALEPYYYNVLSCDVVDSDIHALMESYMEEAVKVGKFPIMVVGANIEDTLENRMTEAAGYDSANFVCLGNTYEQADGTNASMVKSVSHLAGAIAATPSNQSIIHRVVKDAVDIPEKFTNSQYESAIASGLVLMSKSADGQVWYDSGVTTLVNLADNEDAGWKKIKRAKVRNELMYRVDTAMEKKIGKVNCDADGIADVIQTGMGVLKDMANENKILDGGKFYLDEEYPPTSDSAWFVIEVDDIDTLEKIYLHYRFSNEPTA